LHFFVNIIIFYEFNCIFNNLLQKEINNNLLQKEINNTQLASENKYIWWRGNICLYSIPKKVWTRNFICCRCFFHMASTHNVGHLLSR